MLVSKSNGFNASAVLGSGSYNENKSSKHMELLAHSILKLICKEAASETYRGALETLQKMMSECIYQEGNAFVIMGAGEQLKRIKYEVGENNLKVFHTELDFWSPKYIVLFTDGIKRDNKTTIDWTSNYISSLNNGIVPSTIYDISWDSENPHIKIKVYKLDNRFIILSLHPQGRKVELHRDAIINIIENIERKRL